MKTPVFSVIRGMEVLYYFEKPWKWTGDYERWINLGSPDEEHVALAEIEECAG